MELAPECTQERYNQLAELTREWAYGHGTHVYEGISADVANWVRANHKALLVEDDLDTMISYLEGARIVLGTENGEPRITETETLRSMLATAKSDRAAHIERLREYKEDYKVDPWEDTAAQIKRTEARIWSGDLRIKALEYAVAALG